ncbi:MAG: hypothetical protein NT121_00340, partial [Chloroflexi bacterium]|nr:hypothetical protein [Chloroflexota bacterium]
WAGLAFLLNFSLPNLWPRWGFFALIVLAVTGTAIPLSFLLNRIFSANPHTMHRVVARQAVSAGVYAAVLAWLSIGRILTFSIGLWLAIGLIALEYLLHIRETDTKSADHVTPQPPVS